MFILELLSPKTNYNEDKICSYQNTIYGLAIQNKIK